ncbi:MAG: competence/damage-inducible protein A, partial [Vulcanimicrobiaceae bacterium]
MSVSVDILTVGTELLLGDLADTNSAHIARTMARIGVDVYRTGSVGDNRERIAQALCEALARSGGAIVTGGLGPTVDDLTREAVADALGLDLVLHEPSLRAIEARFASLGYSGPIGENNRRQAFFPRGSVVLENPNGTAPGFIALGENETFVAAMPGVPREMYAMLDERLVPWLRARFGLHDAIFVRTLHTVGIGESELDRKIDDLFRASENPKIALLAHTMRVDLRITAKAGSREAAERLIAPLEGELRARIGNGIFGVDDATLEGAIVETLAARGATLATAESLTGGAVADALVRIPGASRVFVGGVIAYDDRIKRELLGVDAELLRAHGAVSEEVARAMAEGARVRLGTHLGLATTGIAGPSGATPQKPVGLVYL